MKNCTYVHRLVLCLCVLLIAGPLSAQTAPFTHQGLNASTGDFLGFLQYKPADYDQNPNTRYPLIIFLHGIGERGNGTTQLDKVAYVGLPRIIYKGNKMKFTWNGKTETFLVIAPQCPVKYPMWPAVFINDLISYAKQNLQVDPDRIFLTGLSMGGGGSLRYISDGLPTNPQNIAAVATCSAPCTFRTGEYASTAHLPVWSFHAEDDPTASVQCTKNAIAGLNAWNLSPKPLLTLWPTGGHVVWDRIYTDTNYQYQGIVNIYEWFLGQNRSFPVNILPVAKAVNASTTTASGTVTLDASASTDADGYLVRYVWKKISGPSAGVITTTMGSASSTTVTGLTIAGTYQYAVSVVDDRAAFTSATITVNVTTGNPVPNVPPVANAGNDVTITLPSKQAPLSGNSSFDTDGSISTYAWTSISGPGSYSITSAGSASTTVTNLVRGTYLFKLTVTDNKGATDADTVAIKVNPSPAPPPNVLPVANAGTDNTITLPLNNVTLNGNGSTDADGTLNSYSWIRVSGPAQFSISTPNGPSTQVTNLLEGTYSFRLLVTDNRGGTDADTVTVTVLAAPPAPNVPPVADAGANQIITLPTSTTSLNGESSGDADGTITTYVWTKISGPAGGNLSNAALPVTGITSLTQGTYSYRLKVTDNDGATDADTIIITVNSAAIPPPTPNIAPTAKAGSNITIQLPVNSATLNGSASSDIDGTITNYTWSKISGPSQFKIVSPSSSLTDIQNLLQGTYSFRLQVKDNDGAISRDTINVIVLPLANTAPIADAGQDFTVNLPDPVIRLNGLGSSDPDGKIESYSWTKVSGPAGITITNSTTATPGVTGVVIGEYIFRLTVTDNGGAVNTDDVKVTVLASDDAPAPPDAYNFAPVASAGDDQTIGLPETTAMLDGSASHDDDGNIQSYKWTQISGPSTASIENSTAVSTEIRDLVPGDYTFAITVTDDFGAYGTDTVLISVTSNLRYEQRLMLYPNPAKSNVMVQLTSDTAGTAKISVYNVSGMLVKSFIAQKGPGQFRNNLNISELQTGLYYVEVVIGQKQKMISRFIKK